MLSAVVIICELKVFTFSSFILQKYYNFNIIIDKFGISDRIYLLDNLC